MLKCNIAVTGLNATDDPAPGVAFIRSIRDSGQWTGKIIGLAYDALDTGIYDRRLIDEVYLLPRAFDRNGLLPRLKDIAQQTKIDVLVPLLDLELLNLPNIEISLKEMGVHLLIPSMPVVRTSLKLKLAEFCRENDIRHPNQIETTNPDRIAANIKELGLPVVIKGIIHESHLAYSAEEALVYFNKIKNRWGIPIIMQEYVQGDEYNADCLTDKEAKLIGAVVMRKLGITEKGKAWSGVTVRNEKLVSLSKDILRRLHWVGPIELEFIRQRSTDEYYLLEINPRFGTWIYLAANAGQNLPLASIKIAMGEKVEPLPAYEAGIMFIRYSLDLICHMEHLANLITEGKLIWNGKNPCESKENEH